jgi:hypothetical protein
MTVADCEKQVLRLLDEVGVSDYGNRIYKLIDAAQMEIATQLGFIRKKAVIGAEEGEAVALPADCYAIEKVIGGSYETEPVETEDGWVEGVILSGSENGVYTICYKAYPNEISENDGGAAIQVPREYHNALCYRAAALTRDRELDSEAQAYKYFMDQYNNEISMLERAKNMTKKARVIIRGRAGRY